MVKQSTQEESLLIWIGLATITLAGLLLRLYGLGSRSFWYDEGATLWFAMGPSTRWMSDTHPPLYYALVHFWLQFGRSEVWLRLLSVIPAVATIPVIFSLGKKLFGSNSGLLAAAFMALLAFHIEHSQQARMYSLFVFFYCCALWALVAAAREGQRRHWITYAVAGILLAYIQGIGILYVAVVAMLFPILSPSPLRRTSWLPYLIANSAIGVLYIPWLAVLNTSHFRVVFISWISRPGLTSIPKTMIAFLGRYIPIDALISPTSAIHDLKFVAIAILFVPTLGLSWIALRRTLFSSERWAGMTAILAFALPILLVLSVSVLLTPMYVDRALLPATAGLVLMLGAAIKGGETIAPKVKYLIAAALLLAALNTLFLLRSKDTEDFRSLSAELQQSLRPEDWILFSSDSGLPQFLIDYYDPEKKLAGIATLDLQGTLNNCHDAIDTCLGKYSEELKKSQHVWIVSSHDLSSRDHDAIQHWLDTHFSPFYFRTFEATLKLSEARPAGF